MFDEILKDPQGILPESRKSAPFSEVRSMENSAGEIRQEEGETENIGGLAIVYREWVPIGPADDPYWMEMIEPGAAADSLRDDDQVALWGHRDDLVLGRRSAGTLIAAETESGVENTVMPPMWAAGHVETVKRGDVKSQSFGFDVQEQRWEERDGLEHRTISKMRVPEFSFVTFPAYRSTTAFTRAALRSAGLAEAAAMAESAGDFSAEDVLRGLVALRCNRELTDKQRRALDRCFNIRDRSRVGYTGGPEKRGRVLARLLNELIEERVGEEFDPANEAGETESQVRSRVVDELAAAMTLDGEGFSRSALAEIISDEPTIDDYPPQERLEGAADYFGVSAARIIGAAEDDGCFQEEESSARGKKAKCAGCRDISRTLKRISEHLQSGLRARTVTNDSLKTLTNQMASLESRLDAAENVRARERKLRAARSRAQSLSAAK